MVSLAGMAARVDPYLIRVEHVIVITGGWTWPGM
jgi:hypothetical protein